MSRSILQAIWPGEKHENIIEYGNSWGTAPIVWDTFCEKHLQLEKYWWLLHATEKPNKLWDSWNNKSIPESHRAVLLFTCDHIYIEKKDYSRFAKDLRQFLDDTLISANHFNYWPKIAQYFETNPDYPALGLWCTTVCGDPYTGPYDEDKDEYGEFDWSKACNLYREIDKQDGVTKNETN